MVHTVSIGGCLREERQRLDLNQTQFGELGGVTKKTQMLYESGERSPDAAYLTAIAAAGADVQYIVTGVRSGSVPLMETAERLLLENYRRCNPQAKANLLQTSSLLAAGLPTTSEESPKTKIARQQNFHGSVGQVMEVQGDNRPVEITIGERKNE